MTIAKNVVNTDTSPVASAKNGVAVTVWVDRATVNHVELVSEVLGVSRSALFNELITIGKSSRKYKERLRDLAP